MATEAEKQELVDTLKFTPVTYRVELQGYGGEIVMGTVSREFYDYIQDNEYEINDFAWGDCDDYDDVPDGGVSPGSWHDCDNLAHAFGVEMDGTCRVVVYDENDDEAWSCYLDMGELEEAEVELAFGPQDETYASNQDEGTCVYVGQSFEKGTFFIADLDLTQPFDPKKLKLTYEDIDGWVICSNVAYNGEELENQGGDTTGKGSNSYMLCVGEDD